MAKFKIAQKTTVAELKEQFRNEVGGVLRVYDGRSEAADDVTLVSIGAKQGELECRKSRTVGKFEEAFQQELNLKVKVCTKGNNVKVLDGITLEVAGKLPWKVSKEKMEAYLSYKRTEADSEDSINETTAESVSDYSIVKKADVVALDLPSADGLECRRDWSKDGYWFGHVNANEEWVIQPIYSGSEDFSENVASVQIDDDKYGYINALGEWVITPQFEDGCKFKNGMAFVKQNGKWGAINLLGEWIVEPIFDRASCFSDDTAEAYINDKVGILDKSLSWVIPPVYDDRIYAQSDGFYIAKYENKVGLLKAGGTWAIEPIYDFLWYWDADEYIKAGYNGKCGFLNRSGNWVVEPNFDSLGEDFSEDLIYAGKDGKYGFINIKGEWVIQPIFDRARSFDNGIAEVEYKGCSLQIDTNGKINGKTPDEYIKENPCLEGWAKTMELARKTESVSFPLHKYGDGFETEEKVRDYASDCYFFLTDNNGNFKAFRQPDWDEIQEFLDENPEYSTIYYGEAYCEISESAKAIYNGDDWPNYDREMEDAICQAMGSDYFDKCCYPDIDFNLIYNGEVIYEGNISE